MLEAKDAGYLLAMLKMCDDIESYRSEFVTIDAALKKRIWINAVLMNLSQIGEYAGRISESTTGKYSSVDWKRIKGLRNIIVHDYFGVDLERVRSIVEEYVPSLTKELTGIICKSVAAGEMDSGLVEAANSDMKVIKIVAPSKKS
ncbi:MAG TPA: HepT-like ribonuclease domain-containing protein [Chitinivibrionales bacterium]|jgi:uncharacterized protein with HEPN domain|nr:HepT-like ribonuclease domain-containing protein [Chitinivibrionales bacterium]